MKLSEEIEGALVSTGARIRMGFPWWLRPWMARDVAGITLGRRIFLTKGIVARTNGEVDALLRHELVHVRQTIRLGLLRFLVLYLGEYVRNLSRGMSLSDAYRNISFEREACAAETMSSEDVPKDVSVS